MAEYRTMTEIATETIREAILRGDYRPGTRLKPIELESELNLGRVAIREALRELSGTGLVDSIPNKGSIVADSPRLEEMKEIFEIRFLLEPKAAEVATMEISPETIDQLEELHRGMSGGPMGAQDFFLLNREFHLTIYRASGWQYLYKLITQLFNQVRGFRSVYPYRSTARDSKWLSDIIQDHAAILDAIRAGNPKEVRQRVLENIKRGLEDLLASQQASGKIPQVKRTGKGGD